MSLPGLLFTALFLAGCIAAFARHPVYGLVTYIIAFYVHPPSRWWGQGILLEVRWSYIAAVVIFLAILLRGTQRHTTPFAKYGFVWVFGAFYVWILIQSAWALNQPEHQRLVEYFAKYIVIVFLAYRCMDTIENMKLVMLAHIIGCFYFGWIAYTDHTGGRFEDFGGPGLGEANTAALTLATGCLLAGSLFLTASWMQRAALVGMVAFIANGIVATTSRSAFLAATAGAIVFNLLTPKGWKARVSILTVLAGVMFLLLTTESYWNRMDTVKSLGAEVDGFDTSAARLAIMEAQFRMFKAYPMGCGAGCTEYLSASYIPPEKLGSQGSRASHNSFLSLAVDQGVFGAVIYITLLLWIARSFLSLRAHCQQISSALAPLLPGFCGAVVAIFVGDMFVPYIRYEIRFWFIAVLLVMLSIAQAERLQSRARQ